MNKQQINIKYKDQYILGCIDGYILNEMDMPNNQRTVSTLKHLRQFINQALKDCIINE